MRLSADAVQGHIVHPSHLHRSLALRYFADSYSPDPRVMPLAIEALERYGRLHVFRDQRCLVKLAQTRATLRWLLAELDSGDRSAAQLVPYRNELASLLAHADLKLASPLLGDIARTLTNFPNEQRIWQERLTLATWDAEDCWQTVERYADDPQFARDPSSWPHERTMLTVEALARHGEPVAPRMMAWFTEVGYAAQIPQRTRMMPFMADLARWLRHLRAIPCLAGHLGADNDELATRAADSLVSLGTDAVLRAALDAFIAGDYRTRVAAAGVMGGIKSELAIDTILAALEHDPHGDVAGCLAHALTRQFSTTANRRAREILLRFGGDTLSIHRELLAVCELVGHEPVELDAWRAEFNDRDRHVIAQGTPHRKSIPASSAGGNLRVDPPQPVAPPGEMRERIVHREP